MAFDLSYDDDSFTVVSDVEDVVEDLSAADLGVLKEEAVSAQRLALMRNAAVHVKGSSDSAMPDLNRRITDEKLFRVSALFDWASGDPVDILEAMKRGRVRARVSAAMGVGKSTFLPFYIAKKMDHRVLYVAPDVAAISQINAYVRASNKGRFMRSWSTRVQEHVCCMTYADFCARESMSSRASFLKHFETVIFDESFMKTPAVCAALKIFAVVATPNINLLLCSANIRTDSVGVEAVSGGMGRVKFCDKLVTPEQAIKSGKLVGEYLCDRTIVILPNDERVSDMAAYYESEGVDVRSLDSATHVDDCEKVHEWLKGDSVTPRVVVAHVRFAVAFNFPLSFAIVWPLVSQMELVDGKVVWKDVQMHISLARQGVSRVGRGIAEGGGAIVMGPCLEEEREMCFMDKLQEFVLLQAASIRPLRKSAYWSECYEVFPQGLSAMTAQQIFKSNLPPYVAARFLGSDGCFASRYTGALMLFSQMGNYLIPSVDPEPVSSGEWVESEVFEAGERMCKMPVDCKGELLVVLQAIIMVAQGELSMKRWQTELAMPYYDHSDYAGDIPDTHGMQKTRLRRVRSFEKPIEPVQPSLVDGWSYSASKLNTELGGARSRSAVEIPGDRFRDAVKNMRLLVPNYETPSPNIEVVETNLGTVGEVELANLDGVVESPGGSTICTLPARVCNLLNSGAIMQYEDLKYLIDIYREHKNKVVASKLFDGYSMPWSSFILSLHSDELVSRLVHGGLASVTYAFLSDLYVRYSMELMSTVKSSHVLRKKFLKLFTVKPSPAEVITAMRNGNFTDIAQSQRYVARVIELKNWIDAAYVIGERNCVFFPSYITRAQNALPIQSKSVLGSTAYGQLYRNPIDYRNNPMSRGYIPTKADYDEWK